jgi:hypothetical protein
MNPTPFYVTNDPAIGYHNNGGDPPVPIYLVDPPNPPIPYSPPVGFEANPGLVQPPANFVTVNPAARNNTVNVNGTAQPGITTQAILVQIVEEPNDPPLRLNDIYGRVPKPFPAYQVPGPPLTFNDGANLRKLKVYIVNKPSGDEAISTILGKDILINIIRSIQKLYINYLLLGSGQYKLYPVFSSYVDQLVEVRENNIARYLKNSMEDSEYRRLSSNAKVYELLLQIIDFTDPLFKKIIQTIISIPEKFVTKSIYNDFINSKEIGNYPDKFRKEILVTSQYYGQNDLFFYIYFTLKVLTVGNFTDRDDFISKSDQLIESVIMDFKKAENNLRQMRKRINRNETDPQPLRVKRAANRRYRYIPRPRFPQRAGPAPANLNTNTNEVENIDILATIMGYYEALVEAPGNPTFQTDKIKGNDPPVITWRNFRNVRTRIRRFLKFCMNVKIIQYPYYIQPSTMKLYLCKVRDDFRRQYFIGVTSTEIEMLEPKSRYENMNLTKYAPEFKFNDQANVKYYCTYYSPLIVNRQNRQAIHPPYWCLCRKNNYNYDNEIPMNVFTPRRQQILNVYLYDGNIADNYECVFQYYSGKYMNDESFGWTWVSTNGYRPVKKRNNNKNYYFLYREYKWGWYNDELGKFLTVPGDNTPYPITDYPPNEPFDAMKLVPPTDFSVIQMIFFIALLEMDVPQQESVNDFLDNREFPDDNRGFNFPKKLPAGMNDTSNFLVKIFNICESISVSSNNLLKTKNNESLKALNYLQSLYPQWNLREPKIKLYEIVVFPFLNNFFSRTREESLFKSIIKSLDQRVNAYGDFKSGMANFTLETIKNLCIQFSSGVYDDPLFYKLSLPDSQVKKKWNQINKNLLTYEPNKLIKINNTVNDAERQRLKKEDIFSYIQKVQLYITQNFFKYLYALSSSTLERLKTENIKTASRDLGTIITNMDENSEYNVEYSDVAVYNGNGGLPPVPPRRNGGLPPVPPIRQPGNVIGQPVPPIRQPVPPGTPIRQPRNAGQPVTPGNARGQAGNVIGQPGTPRGQPRNAVPPGTPRGQPRNAVPPGTPIRQRRNAVPPGTPRGQPINAGQPGTPINARIPEVVRKQVCTTPGSTPGTPDLNQTMILQYNNDNENNGQLNDTNPPLNDTNPPLRRRLFP